MALKPMIQENRLDFDPGFAPTMVIPHKAPTQLIEPEPIHTARNLMKKIIHDFKVKIESEECVLVQSTRIGEFKICLLEFNFHGFDAGVILRENHRIFIEIYLDFNKAYKNLYSESFGPEYDLIVWFSGEDPTIWFWAQNEYDKPMYSGAKEYFISFLNQFFPQPS